MKATFIPKKNYEIRKTHRKESMAGYDGGFLVLAPATNGRDLVEIVVDLRLYWSSTFGSATACIWVRNSGPYGSGSAGGAGYHKQSAAAWDAMNNAGIKLDEYISGAGSDAIEAAVLAIAREARPDVQTFQVIRTQP